MKLDAETVRTAVLEAAHAIWREHPGAELGLNFDWRAQEAFEEAFEVTHSRMGRTRGETTLEGIKVYVSFPRSRAGRQGIDLYHIRPMPEEDTQRAILQNRTIPSEVQILPLAGMTGAVREVYMRLRLDGLEEEEAKEAALLLQ